MSFFDAHANVKSFVKELKDLRRNPDEIKAAEDHSMQSADKEEERKNYLEAIETERARQAPQSCHVSKSLLINDESSNRSSIVFSRNDISHCLVIFEEIVAGRNVPSDLLTSISRFGGKLDLIPKLLQEKILVPAVSATSFRLVFSESQPQKCISNFITKYMQ